MNKYLGVLLVTLASSFSYAVASGREYVEASSLTLIGKLFPNTPNPYNRVDTCVFKGFSSYENVQVRMSSGIGVAFKTNSPKITVRTSFERMEKEMNSARYSLRGYDLYVKNGGEWDFVSAGACRTYKPDNDETVASGLGNEMREYILYFPLFSIENSISIGIDEGCSIAPVDNPFKKRIVIYGSSFMHGNCTSRPGMAFPSQISRMTGYEFLNLGVGGNCKMQPYFSDLLCKVNADAFVLDVFSNPDANLIKERLFPFIEKLRKAHANIPLIFLNSIIDDQRKSSTADSLMNLACSKYSDVYWIDKSNSSTRYGNTSVDGVHPGDHGYTVWAESVCGDIASILNMYFTAFKGLPARPFPQMNQKEFERQYSLNRNDWDTAFQFIRENDLSKLTPGKYELTNNGAYVMVQDSYLDSSKQGRFENHNKYIDLQYVFDGNAILYLCPMSEVLERSSEYSDVKDVEFFNLSKSCEAISMDSSQYIILFPGDAHMPDRPAPGASNHIKKIVVKIPFID